MNTDYKKIFDTIVEQTAKYVTDNNIKAQILGISGGIDSTVVAAICYEVSILTGVPLIGRSLPTKFNKNGETSTATLVGKAFCNDFKEVHIQDIYENIVDYINDVEADYGQTKLANGNIQARIRMLYLYNLAGVHRGIVMDTDNLTENNLGYFTIHGDVGDFNPIGGLWKTEVFGLAKYLYNYYTKQLEETFNFKDPSTQNLTNKANSIALSLQLKPTAGLGITNDDLEELCAESYEQVDNILKDILTWKDLVTNPTFDNYIEDYKNSEVPFENTPIEVVVNIAKRHFASEFKRKHLPIKIISETIF